MTDLTDLRMDMDDVAEMETAFCEHVHIRDYHGGRLADHPWTTCVWNRAIRSDIDDAWRCIPAEYALVLRSKLPSEATIAAERERIAGEIETLVTWQLGKGPLIDKAAVLRIVRGEPT